LKRKVVITGAGMITALGVGKDRNWAAISSGASGIREIRSFDTSGYRGKMGGEAREFSGTPVRKLKKTRLDRATHLLLHATREAVEEAGLDRTIKDLNVLVSAGTTLGGMLSGQKFHLEAIERGLDKARLSLVADYLAPSQIINLFEELDLSGDFLIFSNACASGVNAVGHAFNAIKKGEYDVAICGGYDTMSEFTFAGFSSLMALSPTLCRPFDNGRDGLVLGEGAGILVLEELGHAHRRGACVLGEIAGYGESSDAYHATAPEPAGKGASRAIREAWQAAGRPQVDYINAHGTGTKANDSMETRALVAALGEDARSVPVSSTKPMIGHLLGGAGAVETIISLLAIIHQTLPPSLNYETPDPECRLNIVTRPAPHAIKTALSNSFGFGGSNAAVLLKEFTWKGL
jgi:3-oxoacyl-[acyl-carrier-protein] synthase II